MKMSRNGKDLVSNENLHRLVELCAWGSGQWAGSLTRTGERPPKVLNGENS